MEFHMRYDADLISEKQHCENDSIRFFDYPEVSYIGQIHEADYGKHYGFWRKANPKQLERFSAAGYYFAKDLQEKYHIPIGIIGCNWGGTPACAWMSREAILRGGGQIYLEEYETAVNVLDLKEYEAKFKTSPALWRVDQLADPMGDLMMYGCSMDEAAVRLQELGIDLSTMDAEDFMPVMGPKCERRPSGLYASMLKQIAPYAIRGGDLVSGRNRWGLSS